MTWNHRIVKIDCGSPELDYYEIREIYYNEKGKIKGFTLTCAHACGNDLKGIKGSLKLMTRALKQPILLESKLKKKVRR